MQLIVTPGSAGVFLNIIDAFLENTICVEFHNLGQTWYLALPGKVTLGASALIEALKKSLHAYFQSPFLQGLRRTLIAKIANLFGDVVDYLDQLRGREFFVASQISSEHHQIGEDGIMQFTRDLIFCHFLFIDHLEQQILISKKQGRQRCDCGWLLTWPFWRHVFSSLSASGVAADTGRSGAAL